MGSVRASVHPYNDWLDGLHRITACTGAHFETVADVYRRRPVVEEEL